MDPQITRTVFKKLKNRDIDPSGTFDARGRFYADNADLISVRAPSARWPYSEMLACRTHRYVKAVAEKFDCQTENELLSHV